MAKRAIEIERENRYTRSVSNPEGKRIDDYEAAEKRVAE